MVPVLVRVPEVTVRVTEPSQLPEVSSIVPALVKPVAAVRAAGPLTQLFARMVRDWAAATLPARVLPVPLRVNAPAPMEPGPMLRATLVRIGETGPERLLPLKLKAPVSIVKVPAMSRVPPLRVKVRPSLLVKVPST